MIGIKTLDIFLTILHLVIIIFNLFGWIFRAMRKMHLILISATTFSWFVLGLRYGIGYCPITDWQWQVKEKLGERNLPGSFITYYANKIGDGTFTDSGVNVITGTCFAVVIIATVYVNFLKKRRII